MFLRTHTPHAFLLTFAAISFLLAFSPCAPGLTSSAIAQSESGLPKLPVKTGKDSRVKPAAAGETGKALGKSTGSVAQNPAPAAPAAGGDGASGSMVDSIVSFIRGYAAWIVAALAVLLGGVLLMTYLGSKTKPAERDATFADLGLGEKAAKAAPGGRFSSTKIQAADVNNRLSRSVKTTEVETDREYALVVDEESLKMPPLPEGAEEHAGHRIGGHAAARSADTAAVQKLLDANDLLGAYDEFARQVRSNAGAAFEGDLEKTLGEQLIRAKELKKAAQVLEHHVSTHTQKDVQPEVFFNLGYVHLLNRAVPDSRRYLTLFVETEKNPAYVARARKILQRIKGSPQAN